MSLSTDLSTGVENARGSRLRSELAETKRENRYLRDQLRRTQRSRDKWRAEAWYWKRGMLGDFTHHTPAFIQRDIARRSGVGK